MLNRSRSRSQTPRTPRNRTTQRQIQFESLELRRVLANSAGDIPQIDGDSNADGIFDQSDLVAVFQAGKYETGQQATWAEGDWNGDGLFNSEDLVHIMQSGTYGATPTPFSAELDETTEEESENKLKSFASMFGEKMREQAEAMRDAFFERMGDEEKANLEGLKEALENRDFDSVREMLGGLVADNEVDQDEPANDEGEVSLKDRMFNRISERLESLRTALANGDGPEVMDADAIQKLKDAVDSGDGERVRETWKELSEERINHHREKFQEKIQEWKDGRPEGDRLEERITSLREALAEGKFEGLDEAALAQVNDALEQGDPKAAMKIIHEHLRGKRDKPETGEQTGTERRVAWSIKHVEAAVEAGRIDAEGGQQLIAALEANDFKAYHELWRSLLTSRGDKPEKPEEPGEKPGDRPPHQDRVPHSIQKRLDDIRTKIEAGELPEELGGELIAALEGRDLRAFHELWKSWQDDEQPQPEPPVDDVDPPADGKPLPRGIQMQIDAIRAAIENGRLPSEMGEKMIAALESANLRGFPGQDDRDRDDRDRDDRDRDDRDRDDRDRDDQAPPRGRGFGFGRPR